MIFVIVKTIILGAIILLLGLAGCAPTMLPAPEPRVITIDVPTIIREKCKDARAPAADYPDTDERLAAIPDDDFERLARVYRAGRDLRDDRLAVDDVQIKTCAGE